MAVIEYEDRPDEKDVFPMHREIRAHFDVIWESASVSTADYWTQQSTGVEEASGQSGLVNIYNIKHEGASRISALMRAFQDAKPPFTGNGDFAGISVQGISLKSLFSSGPMSDEMYRIIRSGKTDVRVLFLDSTGEQARFRSYREHLLRPLRYQVDYGAYDEELQRESTLSIDTRSAIDQLNGWIEDFSKEPDWRCRVTVKKYTSAPIAFVLQIGDRVLIEPYNYGKLGDQSEAPATLGTDMPLFEFQRHVAPMFDDVEYRKHHLGLRNPFLLVMDHFDFAFRTAEEVQLAGSRKTP